MTDQIAMLKEFDKQDMASWTRKFIDDLETAFQHDLGILDDDDWHGILCIGMGGSGAGGEGAFNKSKFNILTSNFMFTIK